MAKKKPKPKSRGDDRKLSPKQEVFLQEYLKCLNATEAARKAKFSSPEKQGFQLVNLPHIKARIDAHMERRREKFEITEERIIQELAAVAFGHAGNVMDWDENSVSLVPKSEMGEQDMKFIEALTETQTEHGGSLGIKTLAGQKVKALELLGKHVGIWKKDNGDAGNGNDPEHRRAVLGRVSESLRIARERRRKAGAADS